MTFRLWPKSLAARTALVLILGLVVVQSLGLAIHAANTIDIERLSQARTFSFRVMAVYRAMVSEPAAARPLLLAKIRLPPGIKVNLNTIPPGDRTFALPSAVRQLISVNLQLFPLPPILRPQRVVIRQSLDPHEIVVGLLMPDGIWLVVSGDLPPPHPWYSLSFLSPFLIMTVTAALLALWAVNRLTAPVGTLAAAAERLGRDVNAPPLPEDGPLEVATAAQAFNTMAARIRRFIEDRTLLLTAIGHDLRTPITRLRLRAEFMEDEEQRTKMLSDLDELETMVSATLAFGRLAASAEPASPLDLAELLRTILDEAGDAKPDFADSLTYSGPTHFTVHARPLALKRALLNIVNNAINYGGSARVSLFPPVITDPAIQAHGLARIEVEDDGPGIPAEDAERVFEPFQRLEASRNRETGGVGLGLPIARDIIRAHGGDIVLGGRAEGGTRVLITLPV